VLVGDGSDLAQSRQLVNSKTPLYDHHHAVQFYGDKDSLFATVACFLGQGFEDGHAAIIIATKDHCAAILDRLKGQSVDVEEAHDSGTLIVLDAQQTLDLFMEGDMPDPIRFEASVGRLIADLLSEHDERLLIRAYGEMVDVLWKQGRSHAAIRLEMLWNRLAQRHGFSLLCGYAMGNFYKETRGFEDVCRQHTHIVAPSREPSIKASRRVH
jgi:hypothetical protein